MEIRIAGVAPESIVDGPGMRFTLFVQGCPHNCEGCHNPQTHDFSGGKITDTDKLFDEMTENPLISGITFSGGEPFCQPEQLAELSARLKKETKYNIMCYSGYTFEELSEKARTNADIAELMKNIDILVDGRFILAQKSYELKFKGSANQRVLDLPASIREGKAVEANI